MTDTPAEVKLTLRCSGLCLRHCHEDIVQGIIAQAAREAVAAEREACAQLAEQHLAIAQADHLGDYHVEPFADLIRARSTT